MLLYLPNELIPVQIMDATFYVQQLNEHQKAVLMGLAAKGDREALEAGTRKAVQFALKKVSGIRRSSGEVYELTLGPDGCLTDECVAELSYLPCHATLQLVCMSLITGMSDPLVDPSGNDIKGVKIAQPEARVSGKK